MSKSSSSRAGLLFPVARVHRHLKTGMYAPRIGINGAITTAAAMEYLVTEMMELLGNHARMIKDDAELRDLMKTMHIPGIGYNFYLNEGSLYKRQVDAKVRREQKKKNGDVEVDNIVEGEPVDPASSSSSSSSSISSSDEEEVVNNEVLSKIPPPTLHELPRDEKSSSSGDDQFFDVTERPANDKESSDDPMDVVESGKTNKETPEKGEDEDEDEDGDETPDVDDLVLEFEF